MGLEDAPTNERILEDYDYNGPNEDGSLGIRLETIARDFVEYELWLQLAPMDGARREMTLERYSDNECMGKISLGSVGSMAEVANAYLVLTTEQWPA